MKKIKKDNERLINEDVICLIEVKDEAGNIITNPTNFKFRFYVQNRNVEVICSRGTGTAMNCKIENGCITCYLPKNTFYAGHLLLDDMSLVACDGFDDGNFETIEPYYTGIDYIEQ